MATITIEICNWEKHQPRKDIKHPTWFALSNRILEDAKLFDLTDPEWKALLYIFCQASQQAKPRALINLAHADRVCQVSEATMRSAVAKLEEAGVIATNIVTNSPLTIDEVSAPKAAVTPTLQTRTDHVRERNADVTLTLRDTTLQDTTLQNSTGEREGAGAREAPPPELKAVRSESQPGGGWTLDAVKLSVPILMREDWRKRYPDEAWVNSELEACWQHFALVPGETPRSAGKWHQKLNAWLKRGWEDRRAKPAQKPASIDWDRVFAEKGGA